MKTHLLEGRKREEWVGELGNVAHHKGLTDWRGGRGRNTFVSSETWQVTNEDSLPGGEEEGGGHRMEGREREVCICELGNMGCHRWLTHWRGGRGRSVFMSSEKYGMSQMRTH